MTKSQRKNDHIKIHKIFGHKVLENSFIFHIQWNNLICEWIDGSLLTSLDQEASLINYWISGGKLYVDCETQTQDILMDDINRLIEDKINNKIELKNILQNQQSKPYVYKICTAIKNIDVKNNIAEVILNTQEEENVELSIIVEEYPFLVAQYYMQRAQQNI